MVEALQVNDKNSFASGSAGGHREPGDAGVQGSPVLSDGGGVVAVEDLALRPLGSPMAGGTIGCQRPPDPAPTLLGCGWCSGRTAAKIHSVCASRASLPPCMMPWS